MFIVEDNYILWKKTKRIGEEVWWPYVKYYAEGRTKRPSPLWNDIDGNKKATREVRALFDNVKVFDYVKPVAFIDRIIQISPNMKPGDTVLDFFSGSATTAHAVMNWNINNESVYHYIMVQLPATLDLKITAQKVTHDYLIKCGRKGTLDEVGQERIIRAAKRIRKENPDTTADLGFKHYTLQEVSSTTLDKIESFDAIRFTTDDTVYNLFGVNTVLTTWLVHDGYGFNNKMELVDLAGYTAYWCEKHLYLIHADMSEDAVKALIEKYNTQGEFNPQNVVDFGYSFNYGKSENECENIKGFREKFKNQSGYPILRRCVVWN